MIFRLPPISQRWLAYGLGLLIVLVCVYTIVGERGAIHLWRLRGEKAKLDERNLELQRQNEALRTRVWRLRNDNSYLEKIAREELNLVRPGDIIYRFPPSDGQKARPRQLSEFSSAAPLKASKDARR
jgi:cell division protein FtsB